ALHAGAPCGAGGAPGGGAAPARGKAHRSREGGAPRRRISRNERSVSGSQEQGRRREVRRRHALSARVIRMISADTLQKVDTYWASYFGCAVGDLNGSATRVFTHAALADYDGA